MLDIDSKLTVAIEAEQALLSSIIANNRNYDKVADFLHEEHFSDAFNGLVYRSCKYMIEAGKLADALTLGAMLEAQVEGCRAELFKMQVLGLGIINPEDYARIIVDRYKKRELINGFNEAMNSLKDDFEFDFYGHLENKFDKVSGVSSGGKEEHDKDLAGLVLQQLEAKIKNHGKISGICTGLQDFDSNLDGLNKGNLYIFAGRPGMGKSAFVSSIASNMLLDGRKVGIFSLEMTKEQFYRRILSIRSAIPYWKIDRGAINVQNEFQHIMNEAQNIKGLFLSDKPGIGIGYIKAVAKRWKRLGCEIIFVDHLGLADLKQDRGVSLTQAISNFTKGMKILAKELDIPIILLSQLNRDVEKRDKKRPSLADLRDSGSIEQDADVVMFLYRPEYYLNLEKPDNSDEYSKWNEKMNIAKGKAELIIAKNRHGSTDVINARFDAELMKFEDARSAA